MVDIRSLADLQPGNNSIISAINGPEHIRRRLMEMGLVVGQAVSVLRRAPLGDPIEIVVMHYHVTLRLDQASFISIDDNFTPDQQQYEFISTQTQAQVPTQKIEKVAILGNPNSGKTTLFNALTGLRQKVGNYPGITVERKIGYCRINNNEISIIDLPGTYSLSPQSPDERIAVQVLRGQRQDTPIDAVIIVIDACNLARNLLLFSQCAELQIPIVIALSMSDLAARDGILADHAILREHCGVPVVAINAHNGDGIEELKSAIARAATITNTPWHQHQRIDEAIAAVGQYIDPEKIRIPLTSAARRLLTTADPLLDARNYGDHNLSTAIENEQKKLAADNIDPCQHDIHSRYQWIEALCALALPKNANNSSRSNLDRVSLRIDNFLVHRVWGLISFVCIMAMVFISVFYLATPVMDFFVSVIELCGGVIISGLNDGPLKALIEDGIIAGVGGVIVFVPQIAILTFFLALLEDSGYLARASFLMDRLLAASGLHGKSFVPLLGSHACAIPGIMATRSIEHRRDRLATILVAPFMACAARLPVYYLLITVFFFDYSSLQQGLILLVLYFFGIILAVCTAFIAKKTALKGPSPTFILEFPPYKIPAWNQALRIVYRNSKMFVKKAGTIILTFCICLWAALYYPQLTPQEQEDIAKTHHTTTISVENILNNTSSINDDSSASEINSVLTAHTISQEQYSTAHSVAAAWSAHQVQNSFAGDFGHFIEPAIEPMGYDWKIGIGLTGAFAAREVFVATMGTVYSIGDDTTEDSESLHAAMRADTRADGSLLWTTPMAIGLLAFFAIAMQCISTVAVVRQETGTWTWPLYQLLYMNTLAYIIATLIYQIGSAL